MAHLTTACIIVSFALLAVMSLGKRLRYTHLVDDLAFAGLLLVLVPGALGATSLPAPFNLLFQLWVLIGVLRLVTLRSTPEEWRRHRAQPTAPGTHHVSRAIWGTWWLAWWLVAIHQSSRVDVSITTVAVGVCLCGITALLLRAPTGASPDPAPFDRWSAALVTRQLVLSIVPTLVITAAVVLPGGYVSALCWPALLASAVELFRPRLHGAGVACGRPTPEQVSQLVAPVRVHTGGGRRH